MRIGFFGGTFDPIHNGHIHLMRMARQMAKLDKVIVMPAGNPYHKQTDVSLMTYRFAMCRAALKKEEGVRLSDIEIRRRGPSYTLVTVRELKKKLQAEDELFLICGLDVVLQLHLWYDADQLLREMKIAAFIRPGVDRILAEEKAAELRRSFGADICIYDMPMKDISSTDIRARLKAGVRDASLQLPTAVLDFILRHDLYAKEDVLDTLKPETHKLLAACETELFSRISLDRLVHSIDTMYYAVELALRFDIDPDKTAIAALTHDIAKELDTEELMAIWPEHPESWADNSGLLHGPAGAKLLRTELGITDPDVLDAVAYHTTLKPGASALTKAVYLADKLEPSRRFKSLEPIRRLAEQDLDQAVIASLEGSLSFLNREKLTVDQLSQAALTELYMLRLLQKKKDDPELQQ